MKLPITNCHICTLLNHLNSFHREMFKLNTKFDADPLLYLLSHFECDGHTVHMLIQWCLLTPLSSAVKSPLFIHVHSSLLSLATRLHQCHKIILIILTMVGLFLDSLVHAVYKRNKSPHQKQNTCVKILRKVFHANKNL